MYMKITKKIKDIFWSKVNKTENCWEWMGNISWNGYGRFSYKKKSIHSHRLSWMLFNNIYKISKGTFIFHKCNNKICVNPNHLWLGTSRNRFFKKVKKTNSCWLWIGNKNKKGYGSISINNKNILSPHFSWKLHYGEIPQGLYVLHKCDNPPCVNPKHLFLGTQFDNMQDMYAKSRGVNHRGEKNPRSVLTEKQVLLIRDLYKSGNFSYNQLAKKFKIDKSSIGYIINQKTWIHI